MDKTQENSVTVPVCEEAVDVIDCDESDCPEETFNKSSQNTHDCHGDIEICSFQDEVIPAIKAFCDNKRFSHALKEAENYVTTKCPQLIILYCSLSLKLNQTKEVVTYIERLTTDKCIEIIDKFIDKNFSSFGIQKYIPKIIKLLLNRAVVQLLLTADVHTNKLTKYLKLWIKRNIIFENFEKIVKKLLELRIPNHNVFVLFDTLKDFNRGSNNYLILKWEIFIRAITCNLNEYEYLKFSLECNENHLVEEEKRISYRYLQLAELCSYNMPVQSECLLTAYSLNPTIETYNLIKENSVKINRLKPPKQPKPIENACCKDLCFNTLCDKCGDIKSKESALQLNDSNRNVLSNECTDEIFSGKVFFFDGNVTNNDESLQQMATDLITILTCPRNKLITWELEWETLNQNLLCLLKPNNKINLVKQYTANANSKLQFLKLDYNEYRHLPEPELPGIEKGYEAYLDTDYETDDDNAVATPKAANNGIVKPGKSEVAGASEHRKIDGKKKESRKKNSLEASILKLIKSLESPKKMTIASPSYSQPNVPCLDRLNSNGEIQSPLYVVPEPPSMVDGKFLSLSHIEETQGPSSRQSQSKIPSLSNEPLLLPENDHSVYGSSTADTSYGSKMEPYRITETSENETDEINTTTQTETSDYFDINCSQLGTYHQITDTIENETNEINTTQTETSKSIDTNCSQLGPYHQIIETNEINTTQTETSNSIDTNCSQLGPYHQIIETNEINTTQTVTSYSIDINRIETIKIHRPEETFICSASSSMELEIISHVEATETFEFVESGDLLCAEQIETEEAPQGNFEPNNPQNKQQNSLTSDAKLVHSQVEAHTNENSIPSEDETYKECDQQNGGKIVPEPIKPTDTTIPSTGSIIKSGSILPDCVQSIEDCGDRLTDIPTSNSTKIETSSTSQTVDSEPVSSVNIENDNKVNLDCSSSDECLSPNCDSNNKSYVKSYIECNEEQLCVTTPEPHPVNSNITMVSINDPCNSVSDENSDCEQMINDPYNSVSHGNSDSEQCNSVSDCNSDCDQISNDSCNSVLDRNSDCEQIKSVTNVNTANIECSINLQTSGTEPGNFWPAETHDAKMEELPSEVSEKHVLNLEASCIPIKNTTAIAEQVIEPELETAVENGCNNITSYHEEHLYLETLENFVNSITSEEIIAWSPVAVADPEEITEIIKFDAPYCFDNDFCIELDEYGDEVSPTCVTSIDDLIPEPELEISTPDEENNNFDANEIYIEKSPEVLNGRLDLINSVHSEQTTGFHEDIEQESEHQSDNLTYPEGMAKLKELNIVVKPFIRECHIPLKRLKLDSDDGSQTFRVTEVSNGQYYGFESVIVLNDTSVQKRLLPTINLKPFSHSNSNQINSKCQLINLKRRKSSANNIICNKRSRISDPDLHNSTLECDIDSNKISDEIPFRWSKQSIKNYGRPKNKNFYKEGSYLKKYEKRCITPSSLLINSNLYNSTLNKAALKLNGGGCIAITSKAFNAQKSHNKSDKIQTVFNNVPGLKTYEHLKISQNVRNQTVNIIEVFSGNKSNCVNSSTISGGTSSTSVVNSISNQTVEVVTSPSTSGSVFHHFVQFNNTSKVNGNQNISGFVPGETSMLPQTTPSAIKSSQNIVQFLCKTDGKKIQLTPITNQRISHIQINRVSNENETNGQERENQTTDTILPKFNQAFNNRTATLVSHDPSGIPTVARNLPVLSKLQITPSRPVRISMPVVQKSHSATYSTTTASMVSRSIIQLPLRQLNQMGSNLGVSTIPRQVLITTAPTRLNSLASVVTNTTEDTTEVVAKPSTTNSNNNKSLDTSTLEQLREFDMVLEQVKERSISSCSNTKEETVVTPKTTPIMASTSVIQKVNLRNVAFIQQKCGNTDAPVVVLCGSKTKNQTLNINTKNATNTIKPITVSTSSPQVPPQVNEERSPTPSESQPAALVQKPPQKLQEDEQTIQRIYDILAEYAEQLRNSPDLKNKPAPRRRSNPTINTVCSTTSSQVSNDNDSSSNSSITTATAPPAQIKQTINCSETEANNNSATVLLISSAAINKKHMIEDRSTTVATRKLLISEDTTSKKSTTMSATNTQPTLTNKLYANNCIPLNMMKRQQITILSGSKILTTLPTHQKSNMRNDPIILKTIQPTNSIKSINNNSTRSFPNNTSSPIFVLSSSRNINNKQLNNEVTINSIIKNTTHTATSTTHFATTTANGGLNNNNNAKIVKESSILEKEIKLQKSLSEECEDLGVDEPSASDLFPEADLLLDANTNSPITCSLDDEHYNSSSAATLLYTNKINNETDLPTMNFNYNNGNNGSTMIIKQNNKKRVYGSANWLRGSGCSTRKIVKLSSSAVSPALEGTTAAASMEAHNISISLASKSSFKRR